MAVVSLVSVEEYLNTSYRPDCDYVDGEALERNVGEQSHGRTQFRIAVWLGRYEQKLRCRVLPEVRLQVRPDRFRVPDLMLIPLEAASEEIVRTVPLLCIEILSRRDTMTQMWDRIAEYLAMGVSVCWIVDPLRNRAWSATPGQLTEAADGILRAEGIELTLAEVVG